ncbi:uncharacterized protein LOC130566880 isoform X2 [Triplophysa rosa]|nr:uncharacterized protein LOC130566880 isoform X2 [Triplophysa rosa]
MMNLTFKINDIKIEVSSELGVNSGLDVHLALQNDPTPSAAKREKVIFEISRVQTNPSMRKDVEEEIFYEASDQLHLVTPKSKCAGYYDAFDQLPVISKSEHPESKEGIFYDALDQLPVISKSEHPESEEEIFYDASDQLLPTNESEHLESEEEIFYDALDQLPVISKSEHPESEEEIFYDASDQLPRNAESHHHRVCCEEHRLFQVAYTRQKDGVALFQELMSISPGMQRFTNLHRVPWQETLNEIVKSQIPEDIINNLRSVLGETCKVAVMLDRLPTTYQAEMYTYLSHKLQNLFLRLGKLVLRQNHPKVLKEIPKTWLTMTGSKLGMMVSLKMCS